MGQNYIRLNISLKKLEMAKSKKIATSSKEVERDVTNYISIDEIKESSVDEIKDETNDDPLAEEMFKQK